MKHREKHSLADDALHVDLHSDDRISDVGSSSRSPSLRHRRVAIQSVAWAAVAAALYIIHTMHGDGGTVGARVRGGGVDLEDRVEAGGASPVLNVTIGRTRTTSTRNTSGQLLLQGRDGASGDARESERNSRNDEPETAIAGDALVAAWSSPKMPSQGPIAGKLSLQKPKNTDGSFRALLSDFESAERNWLSQDSKLPKTAKEIAEKYSIPRTDGAECRANTTTSIGWVPCKECNSYQAESGRISRFVFQTWETFRLSQSLCNAATAWSVINAEYDYLLFGSDAREAFIGKEFGERILESYKCLMVGAAKADFWRLCIVYVYGGAYFDIDTQFNKHGSKGLPFRTWGFGNRSVVTGKACGEIKWLPSGCAHQWAMIYEQRHPVLRDAIIRSLKNLAQRSAVSAYDVSFWSYHLAWAMSPYNQSYMPEQIMDGRFVVSESSLQREMRGESGDHWSKRLGRENMWRRACLASTPPVQKLRLHPFCKRDDVIAEGYSILEARACHSFCSSQGCV